MHTYDSAPCFIFTYYSHLCQQIDNYAILLHHDCYIALDALWFIYSFFH